jgi:hypothetical protein
MEEFQSGSWFGIVSPSGALAAKDEFVHLQDAVFLLCLSLSLSFSRCRSEEATKVTTLPARANTD